MATTIAELAEAATRFDRRVDEVVVAAAQQRIGPSEGYSRRQTALYLRAATRRLVGLADDLAADWLALLKGRNYLTRIEQIEQIDALLGRTREGLEFVARGRVLWGQYAEAGGAPELAPELDRAEGRLRQLHELLDEDRSRVSQPFVPLDPKRYAEAVRRADEPGVSAEVVLAELRRRAALDRAGQ